MESHGVFHAAYGVHVYTIFRSPPCSLTAGYGLQYGQIIDPARQVTCLQPALSMSIVPRFRLRCAASTGAGCHYPARVKSEKSPRGFLKKGGGPYYPCLFRTSALKRPL